MSRGGEVSRDSGMAEWAFLKRQNETEIFGGVRYENMNFFAECQNNPEKPWRNGGIEHKLLSEWRIGKPWETPFI